MRSRISILALWCVIFAAGLALAGVLPSGADSSRAAPIVPLMAGFLGGLVKAIGGVVGGVAGVVSKVAGVIPGVGSVVAAGAGAVSAVLKGGSVKTTTPATTTQPASSTYIGAAPPAQSGGGVLGFLSSKFLGVPLFIWLSAGVVGVIWLRKRR